MNNKSQSKVHFVVAKSQSNLAYKEQTQNQKTELKY